MHNSLKKQIFFLFILVLIITGSLIYNQSSKDKKISSITSPERKVLESTTPSSSPENESICVNSDEIKTFIKPISIVWPAKLTGCLESCEGASFTRIPEEAEYQYPSFAGYYSGGIPEEFLQDGLSLRIYGNMTSIDADHPATVFGNKCVPIVGIKKIEKI